MREDLVGQIMLRIGFRTHGCSFRREPTLRAATWDGRVVLQVVGRRVDVSLQDAWDQRPPRTQIVAIGAAGSIDARLLEKTFSSCIERIGANS